MASDDRSRADGRSGGTPTPDRAHTTATAPTTASARKVGNDYPAIDLPADRPYDRIREFYLYLEPSLLAALARGDRREAVKLLNHVLLHIYAVGEERSELLKGLLIEPVVMMSRAAVSAGAPPSAVLDLTARTLQELAAIEDDDAFATWLRAMLDRVFDTVDQSRATSPSTTIADAVAYIREHAERELTRDETARAVGLSPGHFSRLLHERTGLTFTALLRQARIELACELLLNSDQSIADIAQSCGFYDQSHLTKAFTQSRHITPRRFRAQSREPAKPGAVAPSA